MGDVLRPSLPAPVPEARTSAAAWTVAAMRGSRRLPWVSLLLLLIMVGASVTAPLVAPHDPTNIDLPQRLRPPMWDPRGTPEYILGTDTLGRDLLSRLLFGGRVSLQLAGYVIVVSGAIGLALGLWAGYSRGVIDGVVMRLVDSVLALPALLVALVFAISLGPSLQTVVIAISAVSWSRFARVIRGEVLTLTKRNYVLQARIAGASDLRIILKHLLPNVMNTFFVLLTLQIGAAILTEASLSFLGAGIPPPAPSWGQMISEGKDHIATAWWVAFFPGLFLALTIIAFNQLGDWMRDAFDPRLRQAS